MLCGVSGHVRKRLNDPKISPFRRLHDNYTCAMPSRPPRNYNKCNNNIQAEWGRSSSPLSAAAPSADFPGKSADFLPIAADFTPRSADALVVDVGLGGGGCRRSPRLAASPPLWQLRNDPVGLVQAANDVQESVGRGGGLVSIQSTKPGPAVKDPRGRVTSDLTLAFSVVSAADQEKRQINHRGGEQSASSVSGTQLSQTSCSATKVSATCETPSNNANDADNENLKKSETSLASLPTQAGKGQNR